MKNIITALMVLCGPAFGYVLMTNSNTTATNYVVAYNLETTDLLPSVLRGMCDAGFTLCQNGGSMDDVPRLVNAAMSHDVQHYLDILAGRPGYRPCTTAVTYTTNVVESDNHVGCATCQMMSTNFFALYHPPHENSGPYTAPTERTWTTNIIEHFVVVVAGRELREDRTVSSRSYSERLVSSWVPKQEPAWTNDMRGTWLTNYGGVVIGTLTITNTSSKPITLEFPRLLTNIIGAYLMTPTNR